VDRDDDEVECKPNVRGDSMAEMKALVEQAYSAFNKRDIDGALALMTEDVRWAKASEGGRVVGKEEIRAYWTRQWGEFDPHVEPLAITDADGGKVRVRVRQLVRSLQGDLLSDSEVLHVFTVNSGLIAAMDLGTRSMQLPARLPHSHVDPNRTRGCCCSLAVSTVEFSEAARSQFGG
jgi:hypothetical protein